MNYSIQEVECRALAAKHDPNVDTAFDWHPQHNALRLVTLRVSVGAPPGTGTRFMQELVRLADQHGWMLLLQTAERDNRADRKHQKSLGFKWTTSSSRLKRFYRRFGFASNLTYRPDLPGNMHRKPNKKK